MAEDILEDSSELQTSEELEALEQDTELQEEISAEEDSTYIKMDYSYTDPADAVAKVNEIIANTPPERLTGAYLDRLGKYIIDIDLKNQKRNNIKQNDIITDNHMLTVNKRETSFEGLVCKMENGENGIYSMLAGNDKNIIFQPKVEITEEDVATIPGMRELKETIASLEVACGKARGKKAYNLRKQLIEKRQEQYILKNSYTKPFSLRNSNIKSLVQFNLDEKISLDENGKVVSTGIINFYDPKHITSLLCNYTKLKEDSWDRLSSDMKWMLIDFERLVDKTFAEDYPLYYSLIIYKIDGKSNSDIQILLEQEYGIKHSVEYLSSLWRNKIPKMLAERATKDWLEYHYTFEEKGYWKRCGRCGEIKLGLPLFYSKNKTSKDGLYSICKDCRNKKKE